MSPSAPVPLETSRSPRRLVTLVMTATLLASGGMSATAAAQSNDNEWIRPGGGSWNNPRNWSLGFVPTFSTDASFRLYDDLAVTTTGGEVFELLVQGSRVELFAPGCGNDGGSGLHATAIRVQNDVQGAGRRGMFRLLDATCGKSQSGVTWVHPPVGSPDGINEFGLAGDTSFVTDTLQVHPLAGLRFELRDEPLSLPMASISGESAIEGGVRLRGLDDRFPDAGVDIDLLDATGATPTERVTMPRFGYLEPPTDRDVEIAIQTDQEGWDDLFTAAIQPAAASISLDQRLEAPTSLELAELATDDFNGDGRGDLVAFFRTGVLAVFLQDPNGGFAATLFDEGIDGNIVDGTTGDFDGDGSPDLAVVSQLGTSGGLVRLYFNLGNGGPGDWVAGPSTDFAGTPVSIASIGGGVAFKPATRGVAVTTSTNGRGETDSYETSSNTVTKTGTFEVGDDPGTSDPIEDENKKDPDPPIGVGNTATALGGGGEPRFTVLRAMTGGGFDAVEQFTLPGRCVDFASGDLDGDGQPEVLVLTDNEALVLLRPLQNQPAGRAVSIPRAARSIAIGDVDGDGVPEVVIGWDKAFGVHAVRLSPTPGSLAGEVGVFLELERVFDLGDAVAGQLAIGEGGGTRLFTGLDQSNGAGLFAWAVEETPTNPCSAADLDGNGQVGSSDLGLLIAAWGACSGCPADINGDGKVDGGDLAQIIAFWGPC